MPSSSKKIIIEICGLPGSGKTTLAREICTDPLFSRVVMTKPSKMLYYFLLGFFRSPIVFTKGLLFTLKNTKSRSAFWGLYIYRYARYAKARSVKSNICVLDEGPKQGLYSHALAATHKDEWLNYWHVTPSADIDVVISIDENLRRSQIENRRASQVNRGDERTAEEEKRLADANEFVLQVVQQSPQTTFVGTNTEVKKHILHFLR